MCPASQEKTIDQEPQQTSAAESVVLNSIGLAEDGKVIDIQTGLLVDDIAQLISLCKHGDINAADLLGIKIAETAMENAAFVDFLVQAHEQDKKIIIVSPGLRNVPTSSALLLPNISEIINVWQLCNDRHTFLVDSSACLVDQSADEDWQDQPATPPTIQRDAFVDSWVIYVDDMEVSSARTEKVKKRIEETGGAERSFFLFGLSIDEAADTKSGGKVESAVNHRAIDGSLESLKELLENHDSLTVTERLLVAVLNPKTIFTLAEYLAELPDQTLLKLFRAASNADFTSRYNGAYKPTTQILRQELFERGWISETGTLNQRKRYNVEDELTQYPNPHRVVTRVVNTKAEVSGDEAREYSGMKYSDPEDIESIAQKMAASLLSDAQFTQAVSENKRIVITASAYGSVPTAAAYLTDRMVKVLQSQGVELELIRIHRRGNLGQSNFGNLSEIERAAAMKARKFEIESEEAAKIEGATVIAIDDLCATGSHERVVNKILVDAGADQVISSYYIQLTERARTNEPEIEEWLNRAKVRTSADMLSWTGQGTDTPLLPNARLIKMILGSGKETKIQLSAEEREAGFYRFLAEACNESLLSLYRAAYSADGYYKMPEYRDKFAELEKELISRNLLTLGELNTVHARTAAFSLRQIDSSSFESMQSSETESGIAERYSLMKFGDPEQITFFANQVATSFIVKLEADESQQEFLRGIKERGENIVLFVPGSRNVESSSNFVLEQAVDVINLYLAINGYPTIIKTKLSRLVSNPANYANLSEAERQNRPTTTKTMLPGKEFYETGVHVIFGDDVRITGSTADRVKKSALDNGALSVSELYGIQIDPTQAQERPEIENELNSVVVTGEIDDNIIRIVNHPDFKPVQRLLRLILDQENQGVLIDKITELERTAVETIVIAAYSNEYHQNPKYSMTLELLYEQFVQNK